MRQWEVGDLSGRSVVFEAVNNAIATEPPWLGFDGLCFTRNEQLAASVGMAGAEGPGSWIDWDSQTRLSGGTLLRFMSAAFRCEPEVVLVQQWNEFRAPDMYSAAGSNDIEPTIVNRLAGPYSDGWGYYYLNLVTELIRQYRQSIPVPQVMLDTRYP